MTSPRVRTIPSNPQGRDFVVGDVHGCFRTLGRALVELRFDPDRDRLFGVGDLVNRGPHSIEAVDWLEHRFEAVTLGNHDRAALRWLEATLRQSNAQPENWIRALKRSDYPRWLAALRQMPLAFTIDTPHGPVGVVHAEPPDLDWTRATALLEAGANSDIDNALLGFEESTPNLDQTRKQPVQGLRALISGHFVVKAVQIAGIWIQARVSRNGTASACSPSMHANSRRTPSMLTRILETRRGSRRVSIFHGACPETKPAPAFARGRSTQACFTPENSDHHSIVADSINRGPHSAEPVDWLEHQSAAVTLDNHERTALSQFNATLCKPRQKPTGWIADLDPADYPRWQHALQQMPLALTIETAYGPIGIVHAALPNLDWSEPTGVSPKGSALTPTRPCSALVAAPRHFPATMTNQFEASERS